MHELVLILLEAIRGRLTALSVSVLEQQRRQLRQ
eukprot:CAMPEP_0115743524 /NCGR_PEP_ID=MMETSP0272-20121206/91116_1 /TAXON_ID=71861 /ORGANISM="Scrippsiella trochoidea, Strain CCMP3099" /LENGTH=33 /DNA_ID= /DNA_START= /DNA_END= /DNA_ORIENTATION=